MSLIRLGSAAAQRQIDAYEASQGPGAPGATHAPGPRRTLQPEMAVTPETDTATERSVEQLTQFIPTEMVTIFLAAVSAWNALPGQGWLEGVGPHWLVLVFALLTPATLLLASYATFAEERRKRNATGARFVLPRFEMVAATVAFTVWAFAVPGLYTGMEVVQIFAAFAALVVSWVLSQVRRIVGP